MKNGPIAKAVFVEDPREISREDLSILKIQGRTGDTTPKRLRDSHHMIARLASAGLDNIEVALRTGYSRERVGQLLAAPAMVELVALYRAKIDERFLEQVDTYMELSTRNMIAAERHISDAIDAADEAGELLPVRTALAISRDAADRFGYGKKQTNVNVNVDFAAQLEKAIKRSGKDITSVAPLSPRQLAAPTRASPNSVASAEPQPLRRRA